MDDDEKVPEFEIVHASRKRKAKHRQHVRNQRHTDNSESRMQHHEIQYRYIKAVITGSVRFIPC